MIDALLMLAQEDDSGIAPLPETGILTMEWYSWLGLAMIPVVLIGYKLYKAKMYG